MDTKLSNHRKWSYVLFFVLCLAPLAADIWAPPPWKHILYYGLTAVFFGSRLIIRSIWPDAAEVWSLRKRWVSAVLGLGVFLLFVVMSAYDAHTLTKPYSNIVLALGITAAFAGYFYVWPLEPKKQEEMEAKQ